MIDPINEPARQVILESRNFRNLTLQVTYREVEMFNSANIYSEYVISRIRTVTCNELARPLNEALNFGGLARE